MENPIILKNTYIEIKHSPFMAKILLSNAISGQICASNGCSAFMQQG
jgi:hypothetical protein